MKTSEVDAIRCHHCGVGRVPTGPALRAARQDQGLSLQSLADEIGVTSAYLSQVERGLKKVTRRLVVGYEDSVK